MSRRVRLGVVLFVVYLLQISVLNELRLFDAAPDALLLLTVLVAYHSDRETGAVFGFVAGVLFDLVLPTPLGLSALSLAVVGNLVATMRENAMETTFGFRAAGLLMASAAGVALFACAGEVFGQETWELGRVAEVAAVVSAWNLVLAPLASRPVAWALAGGTAGAPRDRNPSPAW